METEFKGLHKEGTILVLLETVQCKHNTLEPGSM